MNRMGGMGRPMGMSMGLGGGMGPMGPGGMNGMQQPGQPGKAQLVSTAALNAVANEQSGQTPFKLYFKDMLAVFIMIPVLITLAATGALTNLGFLIGDIIAGAISSLGGLL